MPEKVGFIFECGRDGPDYQVSRYLLNCLNKSVEMVPRFLDNRKNLLNDCGSVAVELLTTCNRIIVMWDLMPPWEQRKKPCRAEQTAIAFKSLREAKVRLSKVTLLCVEQELECWLMADDRAVAKVIGDLKHPHQVGTIPKFKRPDREIGRPKSELVPIPEPAPKR